MKVRNTFIIFIVSGFWHGANWTFIIWGALNAIYFLPLLLTNQNRTNLEIVAQGKLLPTLKEFLNMGITFSLTVFAWIFFRAENVSHALSYISGIFTSSLFSFPTVFPLSLLGLLFVFFFIEWTGRERQYAIAHTGFKWPRPLRWTFYYALLFLIFLYSGKEQQFIYFQF